MCNTLEDKLTDKDSREIEELKSLGLPTLSVLFFIVLVGIVLSFVIPLKLFGIL